jgi:DNA-binding NtrC family response regulator
LVAEVVKTTASFPRISELSLKPDLHAILVSTSHNSASEAVRFVKDLRSARPSLPCILLTSGSSEALAIEALNAGISLYLKHPVSAKQIYESLGELVERRALQSDAATHDTLVGVERLLGLSRPICELRNHICRISRCHSNVLITGETGTGKELVAELIHSNSPRRLNRFVCLNSTAIPDSLLESELFGHERGAFTGAVATNSGKMALAHKGTLFFDEIGDIGMPAQAKLLRAIDGKSFFRLGGEKELSFDVRILAATNQDIDAAIQQNRFRSDLYYRLNVVRIQVPPLRERREDIPLLLSHYIGFFNSSFGLRIEGFTQDALHQLICYDWPGNIRELRNVVEAIFVDAPSRRVDLAGLPACVAKYLSTRSNLAERDVLLSALAATNWNKTKAADKLQWSRMTLYRKMATYNILPGELDPAGSPSRTESKRSRSRDISLYH